MWPFKPKLKLNFYDPEYDNLMDLFKQINYINQIGNVILDKTSDINYVISLMQAFTIIYNQAGAKILQTHKKKELKFDKVDEKEFNREIANIGIDPCKLKDANQKALKLLYEIHNVRRESRYNKIVTMTFIKTLRSITKFADRLEKEEDHATWYFGIYRYHLVDFLKSVDSSVCLYSQIGKWLSEDKKAIEKYKKILGKKVQKHIATSVIQTN